MTKAEQILAQIEEIRSLADERKETTATMQAQLDALRAELDNTNAALKSRETTAGVPDEISFAKIIRGIGSGNWKGADFERSILIPSERATTQSTIDDSYGGYIVPAEYLPAEFVELLYSDTVAFMAGVRRLPVSGGPVVIPTHESGATTYWVGENAAITAADSTFGQKTAQPHCLAAMVRMSNRIIRDSNPGIETIIRQDIANAIADELDDTIYNGTGASGEPIGILATTGVNTTTATANMSADTVWNMLYEIEVDDALKGGKPALVCHPREWNKLRKGADAAGTPKMTPSAAPAIAREIGGMPVHVTTNLTAGQAILGVFAQALLVQWGGMEFAASMHASDGTNHAFTMDQTWVRAKMDVDLIVRQPLSFCTDITFTA